MGPPKKPGPKAVARITVEGSTLGGRVLLTRPQCLAFLELLATGHMASALKKRPDRDIVSLLSQILGVPEPPKRKRGPRKKNAAPVVPMPPAMHVDARETWEIVAANPTFYYPTYGEIAAFFDEFDRKWNKAQRREERLAALAARRNRALAARIVRTLGQDLPPDPAPKRDRSKAARAARAAAKIVKAMRKE